MAEPIRQAVVLAGGLGTRLGQLTSDTPKPLLPIGGRPFIDYPIAWLARHGIDDIILSTGYLPEQFDAFLAERTWHDPFGHPVRMRSLKESVQAGTAGALHLHAEELDERFLLLNGDTFFDCDLARVLAVGDRLDDDCVLLTLREVPDAGRYGRVHLEGDRIKAFEEKSRAGQGLVNAGVAAIGRGVVDRIKALPASIEREIYPVLAAEGRLGGLVEDGYFIDIGLPETYKAADRDLPRIARKPALFLDRDGVINRDTGYVHHIDAFEWLPGVVETIRLARERGYLVVVVTNQAGVAHGHYDEAAIHALHLEVNAILRRQGCSVDRYYHCPYHPEGAVEAYRREHEDRKPGPGMLLRAMADLDIDPEGSFLIGDRPTDIQAAKAAGIEGYLIRDENLFEFASPHFAEPNRP